MDYYATDAIRPTHLAHGLSESSRHFYESIKESNIDGAITAFNTMVQFSTQINEQPDYVEEATKMLANYINESGVYKNHFLIKKLQRRLEAVPKVLLAHELGLFPNFKAPGFSMNSLFTTPFEKEDGVNSTYGLKRSPLPYPMAFGKNTKGKLGIGDDQDADEFRRVLTQGSIQKVVIGNEHSIFYTSVKSYFGAGRNDNFQMENNSGNSSTPSKLAYMEEEEPDFFIKNNKTVFYNYSNSDSVYVEVERKEGEITKMKICPKTLADTWVANGKDVVRDDPSNPANPVKVTVINAFGNPTRIDIYPEILTGCIDTGAQLEIIWFVNGAQIPKIRLRDRVHFGSSGIVWVHDQQTLYRGKLEYVKTQDAEWLIVSLREISLMYTVHGFAVSPDGESVIIWPHKNADDTISQSSNQHDASRIPENLRRQAVDNIKLFKAAYTWGSFGNVCDQFRESIYNIWPGNLYAYSGFPTVWGLSVLPFMHAAKAFIDANRDLPEMMERAKVDPSVTMSLNSPSGTRPDFLPIVVKAGWAYEEKEERARQIREKEREFLENVLHEVETILERVARISHSANTAEYAKVFEDTISNCLNWCINDGKDLLTTLRPSEEVIVQGVYTARLEEKNMKNFILERIKNGDLEGTYEEFQFVRVETIHFQILDGRSHHIPHVVFVPRDYISILNENLLEHIQDDILNLNLVPESSRGGRSYNQLFDDIFGIELEEKFEVPTTLNFVPYSLRHSRRHYTIKTNDHRVCTFPKILFEIHSAGYNAMRLRDAERTGSDPSEFELDASLDTLERLKVVLMDTRVLAGYDDEQLLNLLDVCRYCLFQFQQTAIITKIVMKAKEESPEALHDVFYYHPDETIKLVAAHRLDIIFSWKKFPMPSNYLKVLEAITREIEIHHYGFSAFFALDQIPLELTQDQNFAVCPPTDVIAKILMIDVKDTEVLEDFLNTVSIWNGTTVFKVEGKRKQTNN